MISVILCVYNGEDFLQRAVDSFLKQTYNDTELILVDDGSYDATADICNACEKRYKNIKVVHTDNYGLGSARKTGLSLARGEWIAFLDVDDWFDEDWLEKLYKCAISCEDVDIVIGNAHMCYLHEDNKFQKEKRKSMSHEFVFSTEEECAFLVGNAIAARVNDESNIGVIGMRSIGTVWDKLYRRQFLTDNAIDFCEVRLSEDLRFVSECFSKSRKVMYSNIMGYNYFINENGLSKGHKLQYIWDNQATVKYYLNHLNYNNECIRQAIAISQLRFLIMDVKQCRTCEGLEDALMELLQNDIFRRAICPLKINHNNLAQSEREVYDMIRNDDVKTIIKYIK